MNSAWLRFKPILYKHILIAGGSSVILYSINPTKEGLYVISLITAYVVNNCIRLYIQICRPPNHICLYFNQNNAVLALCMINELTIINQIPLKFEWCGITLYLSSFLQYINIFIDYMNISIMSTNVTNTFYTLNNENNENNKKSKTKLVFTEDKLNEIAPMQCVGLFRKIIPFSVVCAVCQEKCSHKQLHRTLPCKHAFHSHCIDNWLLERQPTCPICRVNILNL